MDRFIIRDINTHKLKCDWSGKKPVSFKSYTAAIMYFQSMQFGLNHFYEVWDSEEDKIIHSLNRADSDAEKKKGEYRII